MAKEPLEFEEEPRIISVATMDVKEKVVKAEKRIRPHIRRTPLEFSPYLSKLCNSNIYLKLENEQLTGAFKIRGAMNKLLSLSEEEKERGIVTASSGNHGLAVAYSLKKLGIKGTIFLPENASRAKVEALSYYDAPVEFYGTDCVETEAYARKEAEERGMIFIPPYNDPEIIGGQGTIGFELLEELPEVDAVLVPVGGGGLISGIGGYLKEEKKKIRVFGCQPLASPVMYESVKAGRIIEMKSEETLSDGTAGGIEPGAITFDLCKKYVDDYFLLTEEEIKEAIYLILEKHHKVIEGASALPVAALLKERKRFKNQNITLIISGSNISIEKLKEIITS